MNDIQKLESLFQRIAQEQLRKADVSSRGLTSRDYAIFDKALEGYTKTERLLAEIRRLKREGEPVPHEFDEGCHKITQRVVASHTEKSKPNSHPVSSDIGDSIASALDSLLVQFGERPIEAVRNDNDGDDSVSG